MKNIINKFIIFLFCFIFSMNISAQCGSQVPAGSSSNIFTQIRNSTNPVAADKNLNTIVFVHRNNANLLGGSSGNIRYDISTNAGTTWSVNLGALNPLNSSLARYPNVTIYNPTLNLTPSNAYLGFMAATISSVNSTWNGCVTGVRQLNGLGNTENYNQPIVNPQLIPHSIVKGAPGVFWAVDALFNGVNITGFNIYKGTWNGLNDITWANNFAVNPPFNTSYNGTPQVGDYNIAFDPSGTFGWMSFLGHVSPGPLNYAYYPVLYKTINGGATWTGPIQVDLTQFSCLASNMTAPNVPTTNFEHDLTVDVNGNPHILTTLCNGNNAYSLYYTSWHHMFDITLKNGLWAAFDIANVNAGRGNWGVAPNAVSMDMAPQISRTSDGTKIFYSWTDNSIYTLGLANQSPNLFSRSYNVSNNTWTGIKDFSSCNISTAGKIIFPHLATEVLEPVANTYQMASVYAEFSTVANDPTLISNFNFLNNTTFSSTEYTFSPPALVVSILQGSNLLLCPNSTLIATVSGPPGQSLWSNGATTNTLAISSGTISLYTVTAQVNCNVGTASISVTNLTLNASAQSPSVCSGNSITLSVTGNANAYTWNPGSLTGSNVLVNNITNPIYTITANGSGGCSSSSTLGINILPLPVISMSSGSICLGQSYTLSPIGASSYTFSSGSAVVSPSITSSYSVIGTSSLGCLSASLAVSSVTVNSLPILTALSSKSVICKGETIILSATGANSYSWNAVAGNFSISVSPTISTTFSVSGSDANLCVGSQTTFVNVNPLPIITIVGTRSLICKGEKNTLQASGASNYTWATSPPSYSSSVLISPTITTTYTLSGINSFSCANTATYTQVVSSCIGINKINDNNIGLTIYPNPNNGEFTVEFLKSDNFYIEITNLLGQIIKTQKAELINQININLFENGIYFINVMDNNQSVYRSRIIKE